MQAEDNLTNEKTMQLIRKIALQNALQYGGSAKVSSVIGKVIAERPNLKIKIKEVIPIIKKIMLIYQRGFEWCRNFDFPYSNNIPNVTIIDAKYI